MLRVAVVLALVAVALAQNSPFGSTTAPNFINAGSQVRFIPRPGRVLAVAATGTNTLLINGVSAYRVVSVGYGSGGLNTASFTPKDYFGNAGHERFQNINGAGLAAEGHLVLSVDPTAGQRVIRDTNLLSTRSQVATSNFLVVPTFTRQFSSLPLNANDIVLSATSSGIPLMLPSGNSMTSAGNSLYYVINQQDVVGIYTAGLRLGGDSYASNLAGSIYGPGLQGSGTTFY